MDVTKASLLSRVRDPADQKSWQDFERTYRDLILRYAASKGLQPADREDVLQRVLLKLMHTLPRFTYDPARGRFRDYLFRTVRSAISDHTARPKRDPRAVHPEDMGEIAEAGQELDATWEQEWTGHHFRLAMSRIRESLEPKSIEMFEHILAGKTIEQVAEEFNTNSAAVHKVKQRVRDRLAELIQEQIREEDVV